MLVFPSRHRTIIGLSGRLPSSYSYTDRSDSETQYFVSFCTVSKYLNETIKNEKSLIRLDAIRLLYIYLAVKSLNETSNCFDDKHRHYFNIQTNLTNIFFVSIITIFASHKIKVGEPT